MMLTPGLGAQEALQIMCERVGLPIRVGQKLWLNAKISSLRQGRPIDMVLVAQAIKHVSLPENICQLKPEFIRRSA